MCELNDVAPRLVATKSELEQIALGNTTNVSKGWRREVFGDLANKLLTGQIALKLADGEIEIVPMN